MRARSFALPKQQRRIGIHRKLIKIKMQPDPLSCEKEILERNNAVVIEDSKSGHEAEHLPVGKFKGSSGERASTGQRNAIPLVLSSICNCDDIPILIVGLHDVHCERVRRGAGLLDTICHIARRFSVTRVYYTVILRCSSGSVLKTSQFSGTSSGLLLDKSEC